MMRLTFFVIFLPFVIVIAPGCGGNPSGPSAGTSTGAGMFDGQTLQFGSGSSAFPTPGRYEVGGALQIEASLQSQTEEAWRAGASVAGSSGSLTVSSASTTRISGSFAFTLVQRGTGFTKNITGTFDLEITSVDVCR
jgi:hypothetical protein